MFSISKDKNANSSVPYQVLDELPPSLPQSYDTLVNENPYILSDNENQPISRIMSQNIEVVYSVVNKKRFPKDENKCDY